MSMDIFANDFAVDGARTSDRTHRKIELQSPADLTYLIAKVSRAAQDKINKHFPPDAAVQGEDRMRSRVEMLVDDYIRSTFTLAKPNLSINGMDSKEIDDELAKAQEGEEFEAFDVRLVQRIQDLSSQIEASTLELANLRRSAPAETAQRFHDAYAEQDQELRTRTEEEARQRTAQVEPAVKIAPIERLADIEQTWHTSSDQLDSLRSGLQTTSDKMASAQRAADFVAHG